MSKTENSRGILDNQAANAEIAKSNFKVSVIIPVYNAKDHIAECLDSLLNQTLHEMEFIFVDGCGSDNSIKIVEEAANKDNRIVIIYNDENADPSSSRKKGVEAAKGKYLGFADTDDTFDPDFYEKLYEMVEKYGCDVCKGRYVRRFSDGRTEEYGLCDVFNDYPEVSERNDWYSTFTSEYQSAIYLSEIVHSSYEDYADISVKNDILFFLGIMLRAKKVALNSKACCYYYQMENSDIQNKSDIYYNDALSNVKAQVDFINERDVEVEPCCNLFYNCFCSLIKNYFAVLLVQFKDETDYQDKYLDDIRKSFAKFKFADELYSKFSQDTGWKNIYCRLMDGCVAEAKEHIVKKFGVYNELKVSVIIPVYNAEQTIRRCLNSVLEQTLTALEVICVDDCSQDDSYAILQEYAKKDSRIKVLKNETNLRAGQSRNIGMDIAQGEYLHFLDADDYLAVDALETLYIEAHSNDLDCIKSRATALDFTTGQPVRVRLYDLNSIAPKDFGVVTNFYKDPDLFNRISVVPWNGIYKRDFIFNNNIRFNNLISCNDRSFYAEIKIKAYRFMLIKHNMLYHVINNPNSLVGIRFDNFSVQFDSYNIIADAAAQLPDNDRFKILCAELDDLSGWLDNAVLSLAGSSILSDILKQTKAFFDHLDVSFFEETAKKLKIQPAWNWYYKYLELKHIFDRDSKLSFPKVSVILFVNNDEEYISQCVDSLLSQYFKNIEVICIDTGSADKSVSILRKYESKDTRIKVYTQESIGNVNLKKFGLDAASGDYVLFIDGSDYFKSDFIKEILHKAVMSDSDVTAFAYTICDEKKGDKYFLSDSTNKKNLPNTDAFTFSEVKGNPFFNLTCHMWDKLYKRSYLLSSGIEYGSCEISDDFSFAFSSLLKAEKITYFSKDLFTHRVGVHNSFSQTDETFIFLFDSLKKIKAELISMNKYSNHRNHFINFALHICIWYLTNLKEESAKRLLYKLKTEWFRELEIIDYGLDFYQNNSDYKYLLDIMSAEVDYSEYDGLWKAYRINVLSRRCDYLSKKNREIKISDDEYVSEKDIASIFQWNRNKRKELEKKLNELEAKYSDPNRRIQIDDTHSLTEEQLVQKLIWNRQKNNENNEEIISLKEKIAEASKLTEQAMAESEQIKHELEMTKSSISFKIGRAITWLPRKIRKR